MDTYIYSTGDSSPKKGYTKLLVFVIAKIKLYEEKNIYCTCCVYCYLQYGL